MLTVRPCILGLAWFSDGFFIAYERMTAQVARRGCGEPASLGLIGPLRVERIQQAGVRAADRSAENSLRPITDWVNLGGK